MPTSLADLLPDVRLLILDYLDNNDLITLSQVSRNFTVYNDELFERDARKEIPKALSWGIERGLVGVIKRSLEAGADVDSKLHNGCTVLHQACTHSNSDVVRTLLESGCNVKLANFYGQTAAHFACRNGHIGLIPVLLSYGANLEAKDLHLQTPFRIYLNSDHFSEEGAQQLLDYGADKTVTDASGNTLLHFRKDPRVISFLIMQGLDINARNKFGSTPLHTCSYSPDAARMLINANAEVCAVNNKNETPLDLACGSGCRSIVELLLSKIRLPPQTQNPERRSAFRIDISYPVEQWRLALHVIYRLEDKTDIYVPTLSLYEDWAASGCQVCTIDTNHRPYMHNIGDCSRSGAGSAYKMLEMLDEVHLSQHIWQGFCNICGVDRHPGSDQVGKYDCEWEPTIRGMFAALYTTREGYLKELLVQYAQQTSSIDISIWPVMVKWLAQKLPAINGTISRLAYISVLLALAHRIVKSHERRPPTATFL